MSNAQARQQLYDRIRATSKDEVILEEMKRLGFWPTNKEKPSVPEEILRRQGELERELHELAAKQNLYEHPEQVIKMLRKQRMQAAREKRQETKARREQQRYQRAQRWHERRQQEIVFAGQGVSGGLNHTQSQAERLDQRGLPKLNQALELAQAMGISLAELRFLTFVRQVSKVNHYQRFAIAKKTGGQRLISAPMPRLKRAQYWMLEHILNPIPVHNAAHGFRAQRSIVSNARAHCGQDIVVNLDLKDFFPSIDYPRIKGLFHSLGYSEHIATLLALLCSEPDMDIIELDGATFFVASGPRVLPQGAPTSPAISNILCRRLDARLAGTAKKLGFNYTRYADDLSFSALGEARKRLGKLLWRVEQIVSSEGFTLHPDKLRVMRNNERQEVTGIVVNQNPTLSRAKLREFRAVLHQIENNGPQGHHWGQSHDVLAAILGFAHYVAMVNPEKGRPLVIRVKRIHEQLGYQIHYKSKSSLHKTALRQRAAAGLPPRDGWWQAKEPPPPQLMPNADQDMSDQPLKKIRTTSVPPYKKKFSWGRLLLRLLLIIIVLRLLFWLFSWIV